MYKWVNNWEESFGDDSVPWSASFQSRRTREAGGRHLTQSIFPSCNDKSIMSFLSNRFQKSNEIEIKDIFLLQGFLFLEPKKKKKKQVFLDYFLRDFFFQNGSFCFFQKQLLFRKNKASRSSYYYYWQVW